MSKVSTKKCPVCGNTELGVLRTMNMKVCIDHDKFIYIDWQLDEGQKPLLYSFDGDQLNEIKEGIMPEVKTAEELELEVLSHLREVANDPTEYPEDELVGSDLGDFDYE